MKHSPKTYARRRAFQFVYSKEIEFLKALSLEELVKEFEIFNTDYADLELGLIPSKDAQKEDFLLFGRELICDLVTNYDRVVEGLKPFCDRGNFDKLGGIEKTLLIMGGTEILRQNNTPISVAINEYINLAKEFGSEKTPPFINGVLDGLAKNPSR